jgi:hypothetical protein
MIRIGSILLAALAAALAAAEPGVKAEFVGGSAAGLSAKSLVRLDLTGAEALLCYCGETVLSIPYQKVDTLEYGQSVSRRYAEAILFSPVLLLSKSRKHFVTLGYLDADNRQQVLVFRVGKGEIRSLLAALEARTGRRVEFQDNEARKTGKG